MYGIFGRGGVGICIAGTILSKSTAGPRDEVVGRVTRRFNPRCPCADRWRGGATQQ